MLHGVDLRWGTGKIGLAAYVDASKVISAVEKTLIKGDELIEQKYYSESF